MAKFRKIIKDISNLKDAFRVLEIMDYMGGVDIEKVDGFENRWRIKPKGYLLEKDAMDLRKITTFNQHYKKQSKLFHKLFYRNYKYGYRDFYYCPDEYFSHMENQ